MDFELTEELLELQALARTVFADLADPARLRAVETSATRSDDALWAALQETGLAWVALSEATGGAGLDLDALAVVLEEQGSQGVPTPWCNVVLAARALDRSADHRALVAQVVAGRVRLALALEEYPAGPETPTTLATPAASGEGWTLTGTKALVPGAGEAQWFVTSALTPAGPGLFLHSAEASGTTWVTEETTDHSAVSDLVLHEVPAVLLGGELASAWFADTLAEQRLALAALQVGIGAGALRITATHVTDRQQFGRSLGTFQAVQHQVADMWIDVDARRLVLAQALGDRTRAGGTGSPAAARSALVAAWWAAQAGLDVVHRAQHLHGGLGADVDYPVHRHYLMARQVAGMLGGSAALLELLGEELRPRSVRS